MYNIKIYMAISSKDAVGLKWQETSHKVEKIGSVEAWNSEAIAETAYLDSTRVPSRHLFSKNGYISLQK